MPISRVSSLAVPVNAGPSFIGVSCSAAILYVDELSVQLEPGRGIVGGGDRYAGPVFVVIGVGLIFSTVTGVVMAWKFKRDRRVSLGLVIAGAVVPLLLLVF